MGLLLDVTSAMAVTLVAMVLVYITGAAVVPIGEDIKDNSADISKFGGNEFINDTRVVIGQWIPLFAIVGVWAIVGVRQYRRQRVAQAQRVPRR